MCHITHSLNEEQAYLAAVLYLRKLLQGTDCEILREGMRDVLCEMTFADDGLPHDPAVWPNWLEALDRVVHEKLNYEDRTLQSTIAQIVSTVGVPFNETAETCESELCNRRILTPEQAFMALAMYLAKFYRETKSAGVNQVLSEMMFETELVTKDNAAWRNWIETVNCVVKAGLTKADEQFEFCSAKTYG